MHSKKQAQPSELHTYAWVGNNPVGQRIKGKLLANNRLSAKIKLHNQGVMVTKVARVPSFGLLSSRTKISPQVLATFFYQLAAMLNAGISLTQTFECIIEGNKNIKLHGILLLLKAEVFSGNTLAAAMRKHPKYFDSLTCELVAAGEQSGTLDVIVKGIAKHKQRLETIKREISRALAYPIVMLLISMLASLAIVIFIIPEFQSLYSNFETSLPKLTQIIIYLSNKVINLGGWGLIMGITTALTLRYLYKRSETFNTYTHKLSLKIPFVGIILQQGTWARFARTLAITFAAGLPITKALQCCQAVMSNRIYKQACNSILEQIMQGRTIHLALYNVHLFEELFIQMVKVGEESGTLDKMLLQIASYYEERLNHTIKILTELLEPFMTVMVGALIGTLVIAMYLPIFKLGNLF